MDKVTYTRDQSGDSLVLLDVSILDTGSPGLESHRCQLGA